jgi:transcriptional regulator with XRE-family HTH domain
MSPLSAYLLDNGESQTEFAARVAVTQATVSRLCRGAMRPSLNLALRMERATEGMVPVGSWAETGAIQP